MVSKKLTVIHKLLLLNRSFSRLEVPLRMELLLRLELVLTLELEEQVNRQHRVFFA